MPVLAQRASFGDAEEVRKYVEKQVEEGSEIQGITHAYDNEGRQFFHVFSIMKVGG